MKIFLFVVLFFSTTYSQNIVSLSLGNKWYYKYHYSSYSPSSGSVNENYLLEKEVVGDTLLLGVSFKIVNVNKIEEGVLSFVRYEYWHADSLEFRQIGMDRLSAISKIFDLTFTNDSIGIDYFIGLEETTILGKSVLLQKFRYSEGGMASIDTDVETAQDIGVTRIHEYGSVDTAELTWTYNIILYKVLIDGRIITSIANNENFYSDFALSQNYPNPFNPSTTIEYSISNSGFVKLRVYDVLGKEVVSLVNKEQEIGNYEIEFNASLLTSGIYFYRLESGSFTETKKLFFLK